MQVIIDEVLRYWYSLRLRILIALDTREVEGGESTDTEISDPPDI